MRIPFAISSAQSRAVRNSQQRLVNAYLEPEPEGSKDYLITGTPGIKDFATVGSGTLRDAFNYNGLLHVVSGTELYSVTSSGTATLIGTVPGTDRLSVAVGESVLMGGGYYYDGSTIQQVSTSWASDDASCMGCWVLRDDSG